MASGLTKIMVKVSRLRALRLHDVVASLHGVEAELYVLQTKQIPCPITENKGADTAPSLLSYQRLVKIRPQEGTGNSATTLSRKQQ